MLCWFSPSLDQWRNPFFAYQIIYTIREIRKMTENSWHVLRRKWNSQEWLLKTVKDHGWDNFFLNNIWWTTHPLNHPCIQYHRNRQNFMVLFEVSIGSLDMNILEGIKKQLLNSAFVWSDLILQIYSASFNTCYYFSPVS